MKKTKRILLGAIIVFTFIIISGSKARAATPINSTPVLFAPDTSSTIATAGNIMTFTLTGFDPDLGDILTFSGQNLPLGATLNSSTGLFSWTPSVSQVGTFPVIFSITDGIDSNSINVDLTVNTAPTSTPTTTPSNHKGHSKEHRKYRTDVRLRTEKSSHSNYSKTEN